MANYHLVFTPSAFNNLKRIDEHQQQRIVAKLGYFIQADDPLVFAVRLSNVKPATYRYRVGKYRILFDIKGDTLRVLNVSLRDKAYL